MSLDEAMNSVARLLGEPPHEARRIAEHANAHFEDMQRLEGVGNATRSGDRRSCSPRAPGGDVVVLAMGFAQRELTWLFSLGRERDATIVVLRTELSERLLRSKRCGGDFTLASALEMVRHEIVGRTIFVTFPDHTAGAGNVNVTVPFLGQDALFHTLESLLVRKHRGVLQCFDGVSIDTFRAPQETRPAELMLREEAAWLAAGIERSLRAHPELYFGWGAISRKSPARLIKDNELRVHVLIGYLRAWQWRMPEKANSVQQAVMQLKSLTAGAGLPTGQCELQLKVDADVTV